MNNSFARLIDGMCATLRAEVLPRLDDEFARGQVFGVINLLNTFKVRADWSTDFLLAQVDAQRAAFAEIDALLQGSGTAPPLPLPIHEVPRPARPVELEGLRDEGNHLLIVLLAWLDGEQGRLDAGMAAKAAQAVHACMKAELAIELKYAPRPLFAEMSSGTEN